MLHKILCAALQHIAVNGEYILCLFIARFYKLTNLCVYLACHVFGVVASLRVIPAEEHLLIFAAVKNRSELFREAVARNHIPCYGGSSFNIVGSAR